MTLTFLINVLELLLISFTINKHNKFLKVMNILETLNGLAGAIFLLPQNYTTVMNFQFGGHVSDLDTQDGTVCKSALLSFELSLSAQPVPQLIY